MRILAIDYGSARIGSALSDPTGTLARPLPFLPAKARCEARAGNRRAWRTRKTIERILLGLPRHMNGAAGRSRGESAGLRRRARTGDADPDRLIDERLSTVQASRQLQEAGKIRASSAARSTAKPPPCCSKAISTPNGTSRFCRRRHEQAVAAVAASAVRIATTRRCRATS